MIPCRRRGRERSERSWGAECRYGASSRRARGPKCCVPGRVEPPHRRRPSLPKGHRVTSGTMPAPPHGAFGEELDVSLRVWRPVPERGCNCSLPIRVPSHLPTGFSMWTPRSRPPVRLGAATCLRVYREMGEVVDVMLEPFLKKKMPPGSLLPVAGMQMRWWELKQPLWTRRRKPHMEGFRTAC